MITLVAHLTEALVIVLAFFFAIRCLFAHEKRLVAWHAPVKRRFYIERKFYNRAVRSFGWICYLVFLWSVYLVVLDLLNG